MTLLPIRRASTPRCLLFCVFHYPVEKKSGGKTEHLDDVQNKPTTDSEMPDWVQNELNLNAKHKRDAKNSASTGTINKQLQLQLAGTKEIIDTANRLLKEQETRQPKVECGY